MCRTNPSKDRLDGGAERSRNWAALKLAHFHASVSRCHCRKAVIVASSLLARGMA
jgi:hypothetical protein